MADLEPGFFRDFFPVTKEEWLSKVEKDLKGKAYTDLHWQLEEGLRVSPFYTKEEVESYSHPIEHYKSGNNWLIGEEISCDQDLQEGNQVALEALRGGVEAPLFRLSSPLALEGLDALLQDIRPDFISSQFVVPSDPAGITMVGFVEWLNRKGIDGAKVKGAINYRPEGLEPGQLKRLIQDCAVAGLDFKLVEVGLGDGPAGDYSDQLAQVISTAERYLNILRGEGLPVHMIARCFQFSLPVGLEFFPEIAKLRALRILWANVLEAYGVRECGLSLKVYTHSAGAGQDINQSMIRASIQALSAVIGGTDLLYISYPEEGQQERGESFYRRMGRNVQHLLKMESSIHRVADPGAGSYYIEKLTDALADRAWSKFQANDKNG